MNTDEVRTVILSTGYEVKLIKDDEDSFHHLTSAIVGETITMTELARTMHDVLDNLSHVTKLVEVEVHRTYLIFGIPYFPLLSACLELMYGIMENEDNDECDVCLDCQEKERQRLSKGAKILHLVPPIKESKKPAKKTKTAKKAKTTKKKAVKKNNKNRR